MSIRQSLRFSGSVCLRRRGVRTEKRKRKNRWIQAKQCGANGKSALELVCVSISRLRRRNALLSSSALSHLGEITSGWRPQMFAFSLSFSLASSFPFSRVSIFREEHLVVLFPRTPSAFAFSSTLSLTTRRAATSRGTRAIFLDCLSFSFALPPLVIAAFLRVQTPVGNSLLRAEDAAHPVVPVVFPAEGATCQGQVVPNVTMMRDCHLLLASRVSSNDLSWEPVNVP